MILRIAALVAIFAPLAPFQALFLKVWPWAARWLPVYAHRAACAVIGLRREVRGRSQGAALLVANHMSWLDIVALSACRPVAFVGKSDIAGWPIFGTLARLQDTLFVARDRRAETRERAADMARRMAAGQGLVLFAEGTTSDGCAVLPFRSALLAAAEGAVRAPVQPVALAYLARDGAALDVKGRREVAWWGDKELAPHIAQILSAKSHLIRVEFGASITPGPQDDRKTLARRLEADVRARVERWLA